MAKGEPHSRPPAGPAACGVATATMQGRRPRAGSVAARFPYVWTRGPLRPPGHVQGRLLLSGGPAWGSCSGRCHPASPETSRKAAPACGSRRHPMQWQRDTVTVTLWSPSARGQAARSSRTRAACRLHAPERPCLTPARRRGQPRIADTRLCAHAFTPTPAVPRQPRRSLRFLLVRQRRGARPGVAPGRGRSTARHFPVRLAEPVVARPAAASSAALGSARPARRHAAPHAPPVPAASEQTAQTGGRSTFRKRSGFRSRRGSSPSGWKAVSPSVGAGVPSDAPAGRQTCSSRACGSFPAPFSRLPPPPARLSQTRGGHRSPRLLEAEPESVGYGVRPCPPGSS